MGLGVFYLLTKLLWVTSSYPLEKSKGPKWEATALRYSPSLPLLLSARAAVLFHFSSKKKFTFQAHK